MQSERDGQESYLRTLLSGCVTLLSVVGVVSGADRFRWRARVPGAAAYSDNCFAEGLGLLRHLAERRDSNPRDRFEPVQRFSIIKGF
jgi:hypothetical protein